MDRNLEKVCVLVLVVLSLAIPVTATTYDFYSPSELDNFEKIMVNDTNTVSVLNTTLANVVLSDGKVVLSSVDGAHAAGIAVPYIEGMTYAVQGSNIYIGVANGTAVLGSLEISGVGYVIFESPTSAVIGDGEIQLKVEANDSIDRVVVFSTDGKVDKFAITREAERKELRAGSHLYSWYTTSETTKYARLHAGVKYKITHKQNKDWDTFIFKPTNPRYREASHTKPWGWLNKYRDFYVFIGSKTYTAPVTGNYKFILEYYESSRYTRDLPPKGWVRVYVDKLGSSPRPTPTHTPNPTPSVPPVPDNPSGPFNFNVSSDNTKLILMGFGIIAVVVAVIGLTGRRR